MVSEIESLTQKERAYILDQLGHCSYYIDSFGKLDPVSEKKLIVSIFLKLQS